MTAPQIHGRIGQPRHASGSPASTVLQIMSDLHLETPRFMPMYNEMQIEPKARYLALLGDIGVTGDDALFNFLTRQLRQFEVVFFVLGNHEPYSTRYEDAVARIEAFERSSIESSSAHEQHKSGTSLGRFVFLNRRRYGLSSRVTVLGCILFSHISDEQRSTVSLFVSDFSNIADWSMDKHNAAHQADLAWLNAEASAIVRQEPYRSIIVLTRYSPTVAPEANHPRHLDDSRGVQSAFATDLQAEPCWTLPVVKVWAFGHTHYNIDFVDSKTGKLVVANQRGYGREGAFNFDAEKTVVLRRCAQRTQIYQGPVIAPAHISCRERTVTLYFPTTDQALHCSLSETFTVLRTCKCWPCGGFLQGTDPPSQ